MIRFVDGFDLVDPGQVLIKYPAYNASFDQNRIVAGRDSGNAFCLLNNAFGEANYALQLDAQGTWGFHADFQISRQGTGATMPTCDFFRFISSAAGGGLQLSIRIRSDGKLAIMDRFGVEVGRSAAAIAMDTWYTLEVLATFLGGASCTVKVDSVGFSGTYSAPFPPDRLAFRWQVFGPPSLIWDNYIVYDGQIGDRFTTFTGRLRVDSLVPISDAALRWAAVPGPDAWAMVNDARGRTGGSPDGDLTYIAPGGSLEAQLFSLQPSPCFGRVYGAALNACMRPAGAAYPLEYLVQPMSTLRTLGVQTPAVSTYRTLQALAAVNPDTGDDWTDAVISGAYWGVRAPAGALTRVTALYLEKVTSLVAQPYDCGGGPYSY